MLTAMFALAIPNRNRNLGGSACLDVMTDEGIDIEGPGHRRALYQVGDELVDRRKLFVCPALGILLSSPEAQGEDLVGLGIRHKKNYVHETWLVFKDRQDLIANSFGVRKRGNHRSTETDMSTEWT
jgi:hypothetical protein